MLADYISKSQFGDDPEAPHALAYLMRATGDPEIVGPVLGDGDQLNTDTLRWAASVSLAPNEIQYLTFPYNCPAPPPCGHPGVIGRDGPSRCHSE